MQGSLADLCFHHIALHFGFQSICCLKRAIRHIIPFGNQYIAALCILICIVIDLQGSLRPIFLPRLIIGFSRGKIHIAAIDGMAVFSRIVSRHILPAYLHIENGTFFITGCPGPETSVAAIPQPVPAAVFIRHIGFVIHDGFDTAILLIDHIGHAVAGLDGCAAHDPVAILIHHIAVHCLHSYHMAAHVGALVLAVVLLDGGADNSILQRACDDGQMRLAGGIPVLILVIAVGSFIGRIPAYVLAFIHIAVDIGRVYRACNGNCSVRDPFLAALGIKHHRPAGGQQHLCSIKLDVAALGINMLFRAYGIRILEAKISAIGKILLAGLRIFGMEPGSLKIAAIGFNIGPYDIGAIAAVGIGDPQGPAAVTCQQDVQLACRARNICIHTDITTGGKGKRGSFRRACSPGILRDSLINVYIRIVVRPIRAGDKVHIGITK